MNLSARTLSILKSFAGINPSIYLFPGDKLYTKSSSLIGIAKIEETLPTEFGIYDLPKFLGIVSSLDNPSLDFTKAPEVVTIKSGRNSFRFIGTSKSIIKPPTTTFKFPNFEIKFDLSKEDLHRINKMGGTASLQHIIISNDGGKLKVALMNKTERGSNAFYLDTDIDVEGEFDIIINRDNLRIVDAAYTVEISKQNIAKLTSDDGGMTYLVGLDRESKYKEQE